LALWDLGLGRVAKSVSLDRSFTAVQRISPTREAYLAQGLEYARSGIGEHGARGRKTMLSVMICCPVTRQAVYTGIETDELSFANMPEVLSRTSCSACGRTHLWTNRKAWLANAGWLAKPELACSPAMPLKHVA